MSKALSPEVKEQRATERIKTENEKLKELNKKLLRAGDFAFEDVLEEFKKVLSDEKQHPFDIKLSPPVQYEKDHEHEEVACLILSDWHTSEVISDIETNYTNKYNSIIASNRIYKLVESVKQIISFHQQAYNIKKLWIPVLGDMINGSHLTELALTNDLEDSSATILTARLLCLLIEELKTLNIPIEIDFLCGNHARVLPRLTAKRMGYFTADYTIAQIVDHYFEKDSSVITRVHTGYIVPVKQFNHKYILMHGTDVKLAKLHELEHTISAMFDNKEYRKYSKDKSNSFDMILAGHFHRSLIKEKVIINSSMSGDSELGSAWKISPLLDASQTLFGISKTRPKTWLYTLNLGNIRSEKPTNNYSKYTSMFMKKYGK